jgi:hypothetical protein
MTEILNIPSFSFASFNGFIGTWFRFLLHLSDMGVGDAK